MSHLPSHPESSSPVQSQERTVEGFVTAVETASQSIRSEIETDSTIGDWCEETGLTGSETVHDTVARQTALTVVLRSTIFEHTPAVDLDAVSQETYRDAVTTAHRHHQDASPEWFELDTLVDLFPPVVFDWLLELRSHVSAAETPSVYLAECYEELIAQEDRWRLGEFRTPPDLATLTAALGVSESDDTVLAPGSGGASIATECARQKSRRGRSNPLSDIRAVDVSPLRILLGSAAFLTAEQEGDPSMYAEDFFELSTDDVGEIDTVISNPPYTKHHELDAATKNRLNEQANQTTGYSFSKLSPLYTYFTVHATKFLNEGDTAVFLTPAEILNTEYGTDWKAFITKSYDIEAFILFNQDRGSEFGDVATTSLITVCTRRTKPRSDEVTSFIRVDEQPSDGTLVSAVQERDDSLMDSEESWGYISSVSETDLVPTENWSQFFDSYDPVIDDKLVPFEELVDITRGIATGQNSFFCLTEAERKRWNISTDFLSPIVRKAHQVPHYDYRCDDWEEQRLAGTEVWLLYHTDALDWHSSFLEEELQDESTAQKQLSEFDGGTDSPMADMEATLSPRETHLVEYLKNGMHSDNPPHRTYVAQNRKRWFDVDKRRPADILYTSMSRERGRFIHNQMDARNLNNVHSLYVTADLSDEEMKAFLAYLNSGFTQKLVKQSGRTLSSGMSKVEPGDLSDLPVIDPRTLNEDVITELAGLFDQLCSASREGSTQEDTVRNEIQTVLERFLDM